jgi:hypothetical protein
MEFVYFIIEEPFMGNVKIGRSNDVDKRLSGLQTGNPNVLIIHKSIPTLDSKTLEINLHKVYQHRRKHGEWFTFASLAELDEEISKLSNNINLLLLLIARIETLEKEIRKLNGKEIENEPEPEIIIEKQIPRNKINQVNDWITENPPYEGESKSAYFGKYCEYIDSVNGHRIGVQDFTKVVESYGYREKRNKTVRSWTGNI